MKTLVTGGTGFLGKALAQKLISLGHQVTAIGRNQAKLNELSIKGISALKIDLTDRNKIIDVCQNQDVVFHTGAFSSAWGPSQEFYRSNVIGTRNVISGCQKAGVDRLIHVSTPSIYFRFDTRINVTENSSLPIKPVNEYAKTKLMAESEIDNAFANGLPVITIRPRAIFGEGDNAILPRLISRLQTGKFMIIGDGKNITDLTYVDNVVTAMLLCAEAPSSLLGKKYNITNGEPLPLWDLINKLCELTGYRFPRKRISYPVAMSLAGLMELVCHFIPGRPEPLLSRYMVSVLSQSATLDISAAIHDLGYHPTVTINEGLEKYIKWWKQESE